MEAARDPHCHHALPLQAPAEEANGGRAGHAGGRHREKQPPPAITTTGRRAQPSTPREIERVATPPANDDRKSSIVTTASRKRLKLLRADKRGADTAGDPEMRAWLLRAMKSRWP